jgi:hypothetical protein
VRKTQTYHQHVVESTNNVKTGPVAGSYRKVGDTSPPDCPLLHIIDKKTGKKKKGKCYTYQYHVSIQQGKSVEYFDTFGKSNGNPNFRHLMSGDAFKKTPSGRAVLDREYVGDMLTFHRQTPYTAGWTYTHRAESCDKAGFGPKSWPENFKCLASVHNIRQAEHFQAKGWNTARVIQTPQEVAENEELCPYDLAKYNGKKPSTNCVKCRKCFATSDSNIAFVQLGNKRDK